MENENNFKSFCGEVIAEAIAEAVAAKLATTNPGDPKGPEFMIKTAKGFTVDVRKLGVESMNMKDFSRNVVSIFKEIMAQINEKKITFPIINDPTDYTKFLRQLRLDLLDYFQSLSNTTV